MDETILDRARRGDGEAFERLVAPYRRQLFVHCYRSLGSFHDAEDVLQEVLVSAWRALDGFDGRSLRAWLYRIATNRCLNHVRDESRRPAPADHPALGDGLRDADDPWWLEPLPDAFVDDAGRGPEARYEARESVALSFVAGLQRLPPQQRAVLLLRDVMGFPAAEAAEILGTTPTSVNSALLRARGSLAADRPPERARPARSPEESAVVDRFVDAFQRGDLGDVLAVLGEDVRLSMPPEPIQCAGPEAVVAYLRWRGVWGPQLGLVPTRANGQPAFGYYLPDAHADTDAGERRGRGLLVLTVDDGRVRGLTRFGGVHQLRRFGLPLALPAADGRPAPGEG